MDRTLKIGDRIYTVEPMLGEASFLLQPLLLPALPDIAQLYALFTNAVVELLGLQDGKVTEEKVAQAQASLETNVLGLLPKAQPTLEAASPIIARLCSKMPPAQLQGVMRTLLTGAQCNGQYLYADTGNSINILMQGRTMELWQLLIHAVKVNYPDFFGRLSGSAANSAAAAPSAT